MNRSSTRAHLVRWVVPAVVLVALVLPPLAVAGRLPEPIAIHWDLSGTPNGQGPWWVVTALVGVLWCGGWWALLSGQLQRWTVTHVYALGGALLVSHSTGLWANVDRSSWHAAQLDGSALLLAALGGIAAGAASGWALAGPDEPPVAAAPASAGLASGDDGVWHGSAHNRWLPALASIAALVAVLTRSAVPLFAVGVLVLVAVFFCRVRVLAGPTGVTLRLGLLGWPRRHLPLDRIETARSVGVQPLAYGGWGWRRRPGRTAVVIRRGEALELPRTAGPTVVITVDDADTAAGLINDYLTRTRPR